jgi:hypothetical protein
VPRGQRDGSLRPYSWLSRPDSYRHTSKLHKNGLFVSQLVDVRTVSLWAVAQYNSLGRYRWSGGKRCLHHLLKTQILSLGINGFYDFVILTFI